MKVEEVLAKKESLFGDEVTIEGLLVEKAPDYGLFYLAPNDELKDETSQSVRIDLPITLGALEHHIPPWVGTRYGHAEPATLTGTLRPSGDKMFPAILTALSKMSAERDGRVIDVPLTS